MLHALDHGFLARILLEQRLGPQGDLFCGSNETCDEGNR